MTGLRLAGFAAAALTFIPLATAASDQDDALRLAQRVASRGGLLDAAVRLHAPPRDFPASIPLPQATLLGSVVENVNQSSWATAGGRTAGAVTSVIVPHSVMLYYDAPSGREAAVAAYEAALQGAGWKPAPDFFRRMPIPQGGFTMPFPKLKQWCSPGEPRAALTVTNAQDTSGFDLSVASDQRATAFQCSDASPSPFGMVQQRSPLPTFIAPAGVKIAASGPASDGTTTAARIESSLGLRRVFEAFAKQLGDSGWDAASASIGTPTTRTQTFKKTVAGTAYMTLLAVYALDANHYVALADVSNVTS